MSEFVGHEIDLMNFHESGVRGRIVVYDDGAAIFQCGIEVEGGRVVLSTPMPKLNGVTRAEIHVAAYDKDSETWVDLTGRLLDESISPTGLSLEQRRRLDTHLKTEAEGLRVTRDEWELVESLKKTFVRVLCTMLTRGDKPTVH